jgi:hypothetical protein
MLSLNAKPYVMVEPVYKEKLIVQIVNVVSMTESPNQ